MRMSEIEEGKWQDRSAEGGGSKALWGRKKFQEWFQPDLIAWQSVLFSQSKSFNVIMIIVMKQCDTVACIKHLYVHISQEVLRKVFLFYLSNAIEVS